jgi:hypothetical protein
MIRLSRALNSWKTPDFNHILKAEVGDIDHTLLPLQQGLSRGSYVGNSELSVIVLNAKEDNDYIRVKVGIMYSGIIAGCSCADDPTPLDEHPEYCELELDIDKLTAETSVTLLQN